MQRILAAARHSGMEIASARRLTPVLVLGAALMCAGCGNTTDPGGTAGAGASSDAGTSSDADPSSPAGGTELADRTFLSTATTGHELVPGSSVSLSFEGSQVRANAGCNSIFGEYAVTQGSLQVAQLGSTEMACAPELMDQDQWLIAFLEGGPSLVVSGDTLTLRDGDDELVLTDRVVADPDRPLEGTTWQLDTHYSGDAASHWAGMESATLTLTDGRARVATGCNTGSATYTLDGDQLTFGPLMLTRMACAEPAMELEHLVVGALDGQSLTVRSEAGQLTLTGEDGTGLGLRAVDSASGDTDSSSRTKEP